MREEGLIMQRDLFGHIRQKVNLHMHTTRSDGRYSPETALRVYRNEGYDAVALTDHWRYGEGGCSEGMTILSGAEYNLDGTSGGKGVFHILAIGCIGEPAIEGNHATAEPQQVIDAIHAAGGLAVLAHPAWSLNTPEQILAYRGFDATEIWNSVSGVHESRRPDSSLVVDMLGARGCFLSLIADDDTHYYDNDRCVGWIMVEAETASRDELLPAIREGRFYATQGPEVHLSVEGDEVTVRCSPCSEIAVFSDDVWVDHRMITGEALTEARVLVGRRDHFVRAQVTDREGRRAWTNCTVIRR